MATGMKFEIIIDPNTGAKTKKVAGVVGPSCSLNAKELQKSSEAMGESFKDGKLPEYYQQEKQKNKLYLGGGN